MISKESFLASVAAEKMFDVFHWGSVSWPYWSNIRLELKYKLRCFSGANVECSAAVDDHATWSFCLPEPWCGHRGCPSLQKLGFQLQVARQGSRVCRSCRHLAQPEQPQQIVRKTLQGPSASGQLKPPSFAPVSRFTMLIELHLHLFNLASCSTQGASFSRLKTNILPCPFSVSRMGMVVAQW